VSYEDGWAALNLQAPPRVPRTEHSADGYHFELMRAVTGIDVGPDSDEATRSRAAAAFREAWHFDLLFAAAASYNVFDGFHTRMGHCEYAAAGADFDPRRDSPFSSPEEVLAFDPQEHFGAVDRAAAVRMFNDQYHACAAENPTMVNMTGIYVSLFSGLIALFGWDLLLLAGGLDGEGLGEVANRYARWMQGYYDALAESDTPVVYSHDDLVWTSGPVFRPEWYRRYIFPNLRRYWAPLNEAGKKIIFVCDGNYTAFLDDVAACGNRGFWFEIFTDLETVAERFGRTHALIGNADTRVLLRNRRREIRAEVERCLAVGKGCPGYFLAVSNHIPANTPVEAALYYNECYERLCRR